MAIAGVGAASAPAAVPAHSHHFHTDTWAAERGTRAVLWITLTTMVVEITAGWWYGSMALLADGCHMSSPRCWPNRLG